MATLYRKYRPQTFFESVGQNHIKTTLENEIGTGKIAHAYLFCGPRAVGKTSFARIFAKAINCINRKDGQHEPCNKCDSCMDITSGRSLDMVEIDAASHTGVDNVRENIISFARVAPSKNKFKVFIIDEVHMLSISAFNALLKIVEEPPANVIFILCTTEIHKVPSTIISRCERFDFKRISIEDIVKKLSHIIKAEDIKVSKDILESIARQSEGHMRDAESILGQITAIAGKEIRKEDAELVIPKSDIGEIVNLIEILAKKDASMGISLINKLLDDGVNLEKFISDFIEILRRMMLGKINPALEEKLGFDIGESFEIRVNEVKKDLTLERLMIFLEKFIEVKTQIRGSFIPQLPVELAIAELCLSVPIFSSASFSRQQPKAPEEAQTAFTGQARPAATPNNQIIKAVNGQISKDELMSRWNEFLAKIKKHNHSLSFVLRVCQPIGINGNNVCLAFKYKFHKDRINELKIKEIVQNTLKEVYGAPLMVEAVIDENLEIDDKVSNGNGEIPAEAKEKNDNSAKDDEGMMNDLLKTFGGKIVG